MKFGYLCYEQGRVALSNKMDLIIHSHYKSFYLHQYSGLFVLLVAQSISPISCLECLSCQHVDDPAHCNTSAICRQNEFCYLDGHQGSYTMGCSSSQICGATSSSLVGRSITEFQMKSMTAEHKTVKELETRQSINCHECCSTDGCNKDLCKHLKPTQCVDDESVDCARMSTLFSICQDIHKAKYVCARFCNLCSLDGQWGQWTTWSGCDVTCDSGNQTRTRSCTNPSPANGGLDCVGNKIETKTCHAEACPVHGGWSDWSDWGSCSATCDIGLERRDRTCSNPPPSISGDHCYGDAHEDRICLSTPCTDGAWSSWSSWGTCSETCGGGICSKMRTCSNPRPSILGKQCEGTSIGVKLCNKQPCPEDKIAFTAYGLALGNRTIRFPNVLLNYGGGYNSTTGIFTCVTPGIYHFAVSLTMSYKMDGHVFHCYLNVNHSAKLYIEGHKGTSDVESLEYSAAGSFHLNKDDTVYISNALLILADANNDKSSSFTGVLVTPDI